MRTPPVAKYCCYYTVFLTFGLVNISIPRILVKNKGIDIHFILVFVGKQKKPGWREQIPFLVSKGYRVIAPDLRGFGDTVSTEF
jgi:hypothetical protein